MAACGHHNMPVILEDNFLLFYSIKSHEPLRANISTRFLGDLDTEDRNFAYIRTSRHPIVQNLPVPTLLTQGGWEGWLANYKTLVHDSDLVP